MKVSDFRQNPARPFFGRVCAAFRPPGDSAVSVAARERAGRLAANQRLVGLRRWYEGVRRDYGR